MRRYRARLGNDRAHCVVRAFRFFGPVSNNEKGTFDSVEGGPERLIISEPCRDCTCPCVHSCYARSILDPSLIATPGVACKASAGPAFSEKGQLIEESNDTELLDSSDYFR